jgi:hypothetical protein
MAIGDEVTRASWVDSIRSLEEQDRIPAAAANASLLRVAHPRWRPIVMARTSMFDLLFTRPGDAYPFETTVRVSWDAEVFEFRLHDRAGFRLVTADRCHAANAPRVLDAFLFQLAGDLASDQSALVPFTLKLTVDIELFGPERGGRTLPVSSGYRPLCIFTRADGTLTTLGLCQLELLSATQLQPGAMATAVLGFAPGVAEIAKELIAIGSAITLAEGNKPVGSARVVKVDEWRPSGE